MVQNNYGNFSCLYNLQCTLGPTDLVKQYKSIHSKNHAIDIALNFHWSIPPYINKVTVTLLVNRLGKEKKNNIISN